VTISHKTSLPKPSPPKEKPKREPSIERQTASLPETAPPLPAPTPKQTKKVAKEVPTKVVPVPRPKPKPEPKPAKAPDPFASVLKTVEKMRQKETETAAAEPAPQVIHAPKRFDPATTLTISDLDAIRSQISRCWNVPVGAKDAENLVVDIKVHVNPDGTIRKARILDSERMKRDNYFRRAAESAYRAVINPRCSPLRLPPRKYEQWKTFTLSFNPKEMLGT
jgi:outer membrane biosynthesis protein TonB